MTEEQKHARREASRKYEERTGYSRTYYQANKEKIIAKSLEWQKNNREKRNEVQRKYKRRKKREMIRRAFGKEPLQTGGTDKP